MTFYYFLFFFGWAFGEPQYSWDLKSSMDQFTVEAREKKLSIGDEPVARLRFDPFLKLLLKPNRGECPELGQPELTVTAKSGSIIIVKKFYPNEGAIEFNGQCAAMTFDEGWTIPLHRDWFLGDEVAGLNLGKVIKFSSKNLNFEVVKKNDWEVRPDQKFTPDLLRISEFAKSADGFRIHKRFNPKVKTQSLSNFILTTSGRTYRFYLINKYWAIEIPGKKYLTATEDFSMLGRFTAQELAHNRSDEFSKLADKSRPVKERIELLQNLSDVDTPVFRTTLHAIVRDQKEPLELRERVALFLVNRPSLENLQALMALLDQTNSAEDREFVTKSMKRLSSSGQIISKEDNPAQIDEKLSQWRKWFERYSNAHR